jgi:hypothetical protein
MRLYVSYNLCSKLGSKLFFFGRNYGNFSHAVPPARHTRPTQHGTTLDPLHHICAVASTQTMAPPTSISAYVLIVILSVLEYRSTRWWCGALL